MRVLVTGFAGYIGPVVVRHLRAAGHCVIGLDTGWFLPQYAEMPDYPDSVVFGDIRDHELTEDAEAVVHLAGLSNDPMGALNPNLTREINLFGTQDLMRDNGKVRHVIVSSCSVYGTAEMATEDAEMATEETEVAPLTEYAVAKALVDSWAQSFAPNAVSLRLGTVYGYSPGHRLDLVVNRMTYDAVRGKGITVNGNAARPLVHVEDVARAIVFMLERDETGIFNVVGQNWRMEDLAEIVRAFTGARITRWPSGADARDYAADGSKLRALGWQPAHTVEGTIPGLAAKSLALPGLASRYVRLSALNHLIDSGALTSDLRRKDLAA